ncbi:Smr/MutS family protein [Litoribacter ruber]|uniref:Smr/MutS family protein n=1 Tax=Litoribacter ruber TaxID=702568 RepID=UPI001BDA6450|nr:Smr/MutS family protein [Litoribacter ruber]MBT0811150.1 Smr/MutS family protein [Litoribacter ruber]
MNIGDKVRLLHGNEQGIITKISSGGRIEIEIEDGFRIPAMKSEVVIIHSAERQYFGDGVVEEKPTIATKNVIKSADGVFLCYLPLNDKDHSIYLSNNAGKSYLYMVSEVFGDNSRTVSAGTINSGSYVKLDEKSIANFEEWPTLHLQMIPINLRTEKTHTPFEKRVKFKASAFFKSKGKAPLLGKDGYVFNLTQTTKDLDIKALNEDLNSDKKTPTKPHQFERPAQSVDLHIEKLTKDHQFMSNSEMLKLQLETFEKSLDAAIATGMDEISFVHGIGNGVLRKEIHKALSQMKNIKYFQDSQQSRFGYGATLVRIK